MRSTRVLVLAASCLIPQTAGADAFQPDASRVVTAVGESYDLTLLTAGKPADCFKRAQDLAKTLPDLLTLNPLEQMEQVLSWLAVTVMIERAVTGQGAPEEAWDLRLARLYQAWAGAESGLRVLRTMTSMLALQPGGRQHPLVKLGDELTRMPAYARDGIRWIAGRRLKAKPGAELRIGLLEALVDIHRREGKWSAMFMAARTLSDLRPDAGHAALEAEALFELDRAEEAAEAHGRAKGAPEEALQAVEGRKRLAAARRALAGGQSGKRQAEVAQGFLALDEPWRVTAGFDRARVVRAAHPVLDEAFIRAIMEDGIDYERAWRFGREAKGKPPSKVFLSHHIGAGLMMIMRGFYGSSGPSRMDASLVAAVKRELEVFRPADERLADLTSLYLDFLSFVTNQDDRRARDRLQGVVGKFVRAYPADLAGVQMVFLLAQLGIEGPAPWARISAYRQALGRKHAPASFLPVFAGAAVRKAVEDRDAGPINTVLGWMAHQPAAGAEAKLWRANLLAVRGLLSEETVIGKRLQEAVNAYGEYIQLWGQGESQPDDVGRLCDAVVSVATLLMQGGGTDNATALVDQTRPACGKQPDFEALGAVLDLARGKQPEGIPRPEERLAKVMDLLTSHQTKIQVRLWLGALARANQDEDGASGHFAEAAKLIKEQRERGMPVVLAPDLRSLVSFSEAFNMGAGYASGSPFGLAIEVTVTTRVLIFPPAAVDEKELGKYLK